jgi:transposase-like protein
MCKSTTDYNNIEKKIINEIANKDFTETIDLFGVKQEITITWFEKKWENKLDSVKQGELVANLKYSSTYDQFIYNHTELMLNKIEQKFKNSNVFHSDWEIIFNIVKPLSISKPNAETYSFYGY